MNRTYLPKKLADPLETFKKLDIYSELLTDLKKEVYFSLTGKIPRDEENCGTNEIVQELKLKTGNDLKMVYRKLETILLADALLSFRDSIETYGLNFFCCPYLGYNNE